MEFRLAKQKEMNTCSTYWLHRQEWTEYLNNVNHVQYFLYLQLNAIHI